MLLPVLLYLFLYVFRKKTYYISILSIFGWYRDSVLRKIEAILFYVSYVAIVLFLSRPYVLKGVSEDNVLLVVDNSYTTLTKYNNANRFAYLLTKARNVANSIGKDSIYYINYDVRKVNISENILPSTKILNMPLLKFFVETNLSVGNVVIFFTDGSGDKGNVIKHFVGNKNFYYYTAGNKAKNYCVSRIRYLSKFLKYSKVFVYLDNYGANMPNVLNINGRKKKIKNNMARVTLPFDTKFIEVKLEDKDDSFVDNYMNVFIHNSNFAIEYKFKRKKNVLLDTLIKKITHVGNKKIVVTDASADGDFYRVIYSGFSPAQKVKKIAFQNISYFDSRVFKNINQITFIRKGSVSQFMFLEGIPLLATNSGYLVLNDGNRIYTSFGIDDNITINRFWHAFLWKRIIEYAAKDHSVKKSNLTFYGKCDLTPAITKEKEFIKSSTLVKHSLQFILKNVVLVLISLYLLVFLILYFL